MKQAFQIISRMKGYTALSLLGLIISLSGTVIISRYLYQEWTIDHFMPNLERTYVLVTNFMDGGISEGSVGMNYVFDSDFFSPVEGQSEIEIYCDFMLRKDFPVSVDGQEVFSPATITVMDSAFFHIYPINIIEGARILTADGQCMVSEKLARTLFPDESAVGKSIPIEDGTPHTIQAVYRQPSTKSTLRFDLVQFHKSPVYSNFISFCLVMLHEGADVEAYNKRQPIQKLDLYQNRPFKFSLRPYSTMSSQSWWNSYESAGYQCARLKSSSTHLWMLLFVAILLLFVGLFNFVNLYAVMRSHRRHELEVRRIFGASRWDIFCQLYAEIFLLALLTMIGVWTVVELAEPLLATYYNIEVMGQWKFDVVLTTGIVFGLPLISSLIPRKLPSFGDGLGLGMQFFISLALLNVGLYFMRQLHVMMTTDPGIRTKDLLSVVVQPFMNEDSWSQEEWNKKLEMSAKNLDVIKQRLESCPYIKTYCPDPHIIGELSNPIELSNGHKVNAIWITPIAMKLLGIKTLAGRTFNDSIDSYEQYLCMVNETAIHRLGIKDFPNCQLQFTKRLWKKNSINEEYNPPYEIVGVVRDFYNGRMSEPVQPTVYLYLPLLYNISPFGFEGQPLLMDIAEGHEEEVIQYLKALAHELFGTNELNYHWIEDQRKALYKEDQRTARIFVTFSLLAIAVTCLGVLGLMMFDVRRRYREIALRKVNGATFLDIALLLSRRYLIVFGIAAVASLPVSLLVIHRVMASYTIRTSFAWWIPLVSLLIVFLLCALTLWQQVWKATRIKPYQVLKEN